MPHRLAQISTFTGLAAAIAAGALVGWLAGAAAAPQTFVVVADSFTDQKAPSKTHGSLGNLRIRGGSRQETAFVRFDAPPLEGAVTTAKLRVWALTSSSVGLSLRAVADNTWSESTITYNNAPVPSSSVTASSGAFAANTWIELDVTPLMGGAGRYSFALTTSSGSELRLASKEAGAATAPQLVVDTASSPSAPVNQSPPTISGSAQEGQTLSAGVGSWSGTPPLAYSYQWRRCDSGGSSCADITDGASGSTYTLTAADLGSTVRVAVTASNSAGSATASSQASAVVQPSPTAPSNSSPPTISGEASDGSTLTVDPGTWSGTAPLAYGYRWRRCDSGGSGCADIPGASGSTYTATAADVGSTLRAIVTASNSAGTSSATSAPTAVVNAAPPVNQSPPTISGSAQEGQTLSAGVGSWSGTPPLAYSYQWRRCDSGGSSCADITDGASGSTYTLTAADLGSTVRVAVTASNSAGSATASSQASAVVEPPPASPPPPPPPPGLGSSLPERMPESSGSVVYYFDDAGVDTNPCTQESPCRTLAKARDLLTGNPGYVAKFQPGNYRSEGLVTFSNQACSITDPCTIEAANPADKPQVAGLLFAGANTQGWRIRGLDVNTEGTGVANSFKTTYGSSGHADAASYIEIVGNDVHGTVGSAKSLGQGYLQTGRVHHIWVIGNSWHDLGDSPATSLEHAMYLQNGSESVFANNVVYRVRSGYCIHVYNGGSTSPGLHDSFIVNNTCGDSGRPSLLVEGVTNAPYGNEIRNNVLTNPTEGSTNCIVIRGATPPSPNRIDNNLLWNCPDRVFRGSTSLDNPTNVVYADPMFVDRAAGNLDLQSGSPAIGAGLPAFTPPFDFTSAARDGADLGAYDG